MMRRPKGLPTLLRKAAGLLKGCSSFSISTKIPKEWLAQEESDFDMQLRGAESIKNSLNRRIAKTLEEKTGCKYGREGEIKIIFDFREGKPAVSTERIPVFIFGRYQKLVPGLSQSRWVCIDCKGKGCPKCEGKGKHYESVEERIGDVMKEHFAAADYTMHASGREDVDAINTAGRPFVIEIKEPEKREADLDKIKQEIDGGREVAVADLKIVPRSFVEVVTESHFDKEYEAEVEFEKEVGKKDLKRIEELNGMIVSQRTPTRVSHRRADKVRKRRILQLKTTKTQDPKHLTFRLRAEAGTYIKELISGDGGRTKPSFAQLLGMDAKCTELAVTEIDDNFLDMVIV